MSTYGMESMIYLTAGIMDEFNNPDIAVEAAICKVSKTLGYLLY